MALIPLVAKGIELAVKEIKKSVDKSRKSKQGKVQKPKARKQNVSGLTHVSVPAAQSLRLKSKQPRVVSGPNGNLCVRHRELLLSTINSSQLWTEVVDLSLNPGDEVTFPWLSGIAQHYTYYRVRSCKFIYVPRTSTSNQGSVQMAIDYDASDSGPANEAIMSSYQGFVDGPLWRDVTCVASSKFAHMNQPWKLIRSPATTQDSQVVNFDFGNFYLYTSDGPSSAVPAGKLYVEYDFEFMTPSFPPFGSSVQFYNETQAGGTLSVTAPLGSAPSTLNGPTFVTYSGGTNYISLPSGINYWRISWKLSGTSLTNDSLGVFLGTGTVTNQINCTNSASTYVAEQDIVTNNTPEVPLILTFTITGTVSGCVMYITSIPTIDV